MRLASRILAQKEILKDRVIEDIQDSCSLEDLILVAVKAGYSLKILALGFEEGERNLIVDLCEREKTVATIEIYGKCLHDIYKFQALPENMPHYCDKPGVLIDEEWFDRRDSRLRFKIDPWKGERLAAPTALAELVLSYAFSSHGIVELNRDIIEIQTGIREVIKLKLVFLGSDLEKEEGWMEVVFVVLGKLETLLAKRKAKRELIHNESCL